MPAIERAGERLRGVPAFGSARGWLKRLYHAALMAQSGGRGLESVLPGGEVIRALPAHRQLAWNPDEYNAFRAAVRPGMIALDVGANVGAYALVLGQWVGPRGTVYAFEPAPQAYDGLVGHIALNGLTDVVQPIAMAVGGSAATARLLVAGTHGESRLGGHSELEGPSIDVSVTTIDDFCARHHLEPDFIKVDVEGAELDVLRGARETIRRRGRDLSLFVEMHPSIWALSGISQKDILDELDMQSLEPYSLTPGDTLWAVEGVSVQLRRR
jgi:FkbM family methyltransferase